MCIIMYAPPPFPALPTSPSSSAFCVQDDDNAPPSSSPSARNSQGKRNTGVIPNGVSHGGGASGVPDAPKSRSGMVNGPDRSKPSSGSTQKRREKRKHCEQQGALSPSQDPPQLQHRKKEEEKKKKHKHKQSRDGRCEGQRVSHLVKRRTYRQQDQEEEEEE